jgi:hypothetical protein
MDAPLYVDDTQNQSIDEVCAKIKKLVQEYGVKIAFIDPLQLMEGQNCIQSLKALAKELTTPIIVLSQAEGLPQDADIVLSVNRKDEGTALISIANNTQGNNGEVIVSFK